MVQEPPSQKTWTKTLMKTFSSNPGGAGQGAVPSTPSSSNVPTSSKSIDINSVYMFFEELKVAFEKGQPKQSDGSQVQTEVYTPKCSVRFSLPSCLSSAFVSRILLWTIPKYPLLRIIPKKSGRWAKRSRRKIPKPPNN